MKLAPEIKTLFPQLCVRENALLREYTTFRLGGPCPLLIEGATAEQLPAITKLLNKTGQPFLVIGQGANLIISDKGIDQVVIRFCSETPDIQITYHDSNSATHPGLRPPLQGRGTVRIPSMGGVPERRPVLSTVEGGESLSNASINTGSERPLVTVSGDTRLDDLALFTIENAVGNLSYCSGIPGTVGGGIAGNAGAFGRQMGDHLISVELLGLNGQTRTVLHDELEFSYRHSKLKETGEIVLSATFKLPVVEQAVMQAERDRIMEFRRTHHPDWHETPCAGSVFRNIEPTSAVERRKAAGFFLQEAGAHLFRVGGARLYEKHANIIVADPGCTAQDVWELSEKMIRAVKDKFGIELIREVRFLGSFTT